MRVDNLEDVPSVVIDSSDGGGEANTFVEDAPDSLDMAMDVGFVVDEGSEGTIVYPIYGSASSDGDMDYYKVKLNAGGDVIVYLKPEVVDYDLYVYSPTGELYGKSRLAGDSVDAVVIPKNTLESWGDSMIIGVRHYSGDGVYIVTFGYLSQETDVYVPPNHNSG